MKISVWLFLSWIGLCSAINWNTITKEELSALPPSVFVNITAVELGSIPPLSCEGQMGNISGFSAAGFTKDQIANLSSSSSGGCAGFTRDQMGNITSEAYAGFTDVCVGRINEVSFGAISKEQVANWTPNAFSGILSFIHLNEGIREEQMRNLTGLSAAGFTKDQIAKFKSSDTWVCRGLSQDHMGNITSEAYAGFAYQCVRDMRGVSFGAISKEQVANWTPNAFSGILSLIHLNEGIREEQMSNLTGLSAAGFTEDQITKLSNSGCSGLSRDHMGNITSEAYAVFTDGCVRSIRNSSILGITPDKVKSLTKVFCSAFRPDQVQFIRNDSLVEFSLEQLQHFKSQAVSGFVSFQLGHLVLHWNASFIDLYNISHWIGYSLESKVAFKDLIFKSIEPIKALPPMDDIPSLTWFQLALVKNTPDFNPILLWRVVKALNYTTIGGLRRDFVPLLIPDISPLQATGLTGDITFAMNSSQLNAFPPDVFRNISLNALYGIDPLNVPSLTPQQIVSLPSQVYSQMPCAMITRFTNVQISAMDADQHSQWATRFRYCSSPTTSTSTTGTFPTTSSTGSITSGSSTSGSVTSGSSTTGEQANTENGSKDIIIALIAIGGAIVIAVVIVGGFLFKKMRIQSEHQPLLQDDA